MFSPTLKFFGGFEDLELLEYLEMVVVGEDGGADVLGAGSNEDVLWGEGDTRSVKRPGAGGGLFPDFIRGWDVKPWLEDITADIISYLDKRFPNIQKEQVFGFLPPAFEVTPLKNIVGAEGMFSKDIVDTAYADIYCVMSYTKYINAKYKIERTYSGITMNPELDHPELNSPSFRDTREFNKNDLSSFQGPGPNMRPFEMLYKNWVMAQYENFNIQDLRELTRSCNTSFAELKIPNAENIRIRGSEYACQTCFFCEERKWGHENRHLYLEEYHKWILP